MVIVGLFLVCFKCNFVPSTKDDDEKIGAKSVLASRG
jgi:hypothetical protein